MYGKERLPWRTLDFSLDLEFRFSSNVDMSLENREPLLNMNVEQLRTLRMMVNLSRRIPPRKDIWPTAMSFCSQSNCEDVRDKIFGIQSVFPDELQIEIDYALSPMEVYQLPRRMSGICPGWDLQL